MRVALLTRDNAFQIYCANFLSRKGLLGLVILERGVSSAAQHPGIRSFSICRKICDRVPTIWTRPLTLIEYTRYLVNKKKYYGSQGYHNRRIFGEGYESLPGGLSSIVVGDINCAEVENALRAFGPDLVFVFGTTLIKSNLFEGVSARFVNMHWGWSPNYRGEGIVSALAKRGIAGLGVTVHILSAKIDGGEILFQASPSIDYHDNFYSIGLKLTILGSRLFVRAIEDFRANGELVGQAQDLKKGQLYDSKYLKRHPELFQKAWKNLRNQAFDTGM